MGDDELADRPADASLSPPELLAEGYRPYERYRLTLKSEGTAVAQTRDILRGGKVVAVLPVDIAQDKLVLIRQFRFAAHLAYGRGDMVEIVAGGAEQGESLEQTARRECEEEIGVTPAKLVELFTFMTTPGITDERITVFLAAIDCTRVPARGGSAAEGEQIETMCVSIDAALAALGHGTMRNGPLLLALQWLALNRGRVRDLLP
jgi:ADP-ribose diphosphatase